MRFKNTNRENFPLPISGVLADICISSSSSISQDSIEKDFGEFPIYGANGEIKKISKYEKESSYVAIVKDGAGVGRVIIANPFSSVIGTLNYIENKPNCNLLYLYYLLQKLDFTKYVVGSGIPHIYFKDYKHVEIKIPTLKEQEKIGEFLGSFDKIIQKQQEKIGLLKEFKKGHLQQMFPSKDSNVPKIRFEKFTDAWEQCKLGDMAESFEYGLNASATEYDGINKYLRITDIDEDTRLFKTGDITSPNIDYNGSDNYLLKNGDILFARTGASVGKSYIYKENDGRVYFAGFLIRARIKSNYSPQFIYQTTVRDDYAKKIMITSQRSGQPGVNAKEYSNFEFLIPSHKEQIKIGDYFEKIDNLITLHQRKLKSLEDLKQGYMQRLYAL